MSVPTPSPSPGPSPIPPPPGGQAYNLKKQALEKVLDKLEQAQDDLDADPATAGMTPKSALLTDGLGGSESVWQSPLADTMHDTLVEIIDSMTSNLRSATIEVQDAWNDEPTYVDEDDSRATWGE
ncbi:hypothetical protein [Actinomyces sp. MRS3W]|uniref:hypothetical protein n=1 Tax=Actinomyces sp. MRS3W TaxID=2800796 RepID=UPI0028FD758C|nr:hypothetical protein [Actinomyces sp. MRS3W]MDU0348416.1 hypothetical protein [Actinomyces sp. MRS3W]